ncbi:transcriptional regulator, LysR family [Burkholderia ambifaria IOP40-10]|uniref:Transcriptional regulator, LysR family n=1 Tax=Burkholderia ambifaria IOP40-10 TaxID=396596 RepID=B1FMD1_9BURK|nr:LysR family transcriptional regulator [Burkholderia ambifaria]EDT01285.1 transcriptional regulator, LysR family [Burkholderia ambifaria IOP40-10]
MRNLDLYAAMRIFVRVVETGSISTAARDLGMGQSTVSERIDRLESHLGLKLLFRNARALSCTTDGEVFYANCKKALESMETAFSIGKCHREVRGTIRIGAPQALGEIVLPPVLTDIRNRFPDLNIELLLNDKVIDPATAGVDLSLRLMPQQDDVRYPNFIGIAPHVLVASPRYLGQFPEITKPEMLADHPFLWVCGVYNSRQLNLIRADETRVSVPLNITLTVNHWRPAREQLIEGFGFSVLQQRVCLDAIADGRLREILPSYRVPRLVLHVVFPGTGAVPPKTKAVYAVLKENLPELLLHTRA